MDPMGNLMKSGEIRVKGSTKTIAISTVAIAPGPKTTKASGMLGCEFRDARNGNSPKYLSYKLGFATLRC